MNSESQPNAEKNESTDTSIYSLLLLFVGFVILFGLTIVVMYLISKRKQDSNESLATRLCESVVNEIKNISDSSTSISTLTPTSTNLEEVEGLVKSMFNK